MTSEYSDGNWRGPSTIISLPVSALGHCLAFSSGSNVAESSAKTSNDCRWANRPVRQRSIAYCCFQNEMSSSLISLIQALCSLLKVRTNGGKAIFSLCSTVSCACCFCAVDWEVIVFTCVGGDA
jgi:hypothetical protein